MRIPLGALVIVQCAVSVLLAGCVTSAGPIAGQSMKEQAAIEATAIVERAEATAMVLKAQSIATAMIRQASVPQPVLPTITPTAAPAPVRATTEPTPTGTAITDAGSAQVELLAVDFAAEGSYIHVEFRAPPRLTRQWGQGNVSVTDEATGITYNGIPVAPLIGPLIGRPLNAGQIGYVMLVNTGDGLHTGSFVTVVLGNFKQEHVLVGGNH